MNYNEFNCYGCENKTCDECKDFSNYRGVFGKREYLSDKDIKEICSDCSCYFECFGEHGIFDLEYAKQCYNIMFG